MTKVAHLVDSISRNAGGVSAVVKSLTAALARDADLAISVESLSDSLSSADLPDWNPVPVRVHPPTGPRRFGFSRSLSQSLLAAEADLFHVHAIWQGQSAAMLKTHRRTEKPYLISPHGMLDAWALRNSVWKKRLAAALYENAHLGECTGFHALAESERDAIRAYGLRQPVCVIPNGVELPLLEAIKRRAPKTLLYLGRFHPKKGLAEALRAWKEVAGREDWRFVIAGWDQNGHEAELETLCRELGVSFSTKNDESGTKKREGLIFAGPAFGDEKDRLFRNADAFILPSHSEGLPMAVLEAWSYALPVLMTEACNLPEGFNSGAAIRIQAEPKSIGDGLRNLFAMGEDERRSMGDRGRTLVEERFTWPRVASQMKEVYQWMLGGGSKPGTVD